MAGFSLPRTPNAQSMIGTLPPAPAAAPPSPQDLIADLLDEERFKTRRDEALQGIEAKRDKDLQSGRDFIKDFSLERIKETPFATENEKLRTLLESRLGGLNAGEGAALREQAFRGLNQQRQGDIRDLRGIQGAQGVRGPAAVAQQQNVFSQAADRGSDLEQQLLLRNIDIQRQAAGDFSGEISRQGTQQLGIDQFNIGQSTQEAKLKQAFPFLFANLGAQEQASATGNITSRDALIAALFPGLLSGGQPGQPGVLPATPEPEVGSTGITPEQAVFSGIATGRNPQTTPRSKKKPISIEGLKGSLADGGFVI